MSYKLIIAGSRNFTDFRLFSQVCDKLYKQKPFSIISGGARGADSLAETYADLRGLKCEVFPADWDKHGKKAGYLRNKQMSEEGDALLAFWDGNSRGTMHMIDIAMMRALPVKICYFKEKRITRWK